MLSGYGPALAISSRDLNNGGCLCRRQARAFSAAMASARTSPPTVVFTLTRPPVQTMSPVTVVHTPRACWCRIHLCLSVCLCLSRSFSPPSLCLTLSLSHFLSPLLLSLPPEYISNLYTHPPSRCSNSRNCQLSLPRPRPRIDIFKTSIAFSDAFLWNNLPLTVRSCQSLSSFKRKLRTHLEVVT